jgi:predicted AlkP superfamily phosphohydrolase/phosphomutase
VLGVDGMDPAFVERHWDALPNLRALRDSGYFGRLRTTNPPQSPVAWSTFITGLDPDQHGIYDFVHRDPTTLSLFSSMSKTEDPKLVLPLGPYLLPLSSPRVFIPRDGTPFWRTLTEHGIPAIVQHMPVNYPPEAAGRGLSGMGTPDLLGTLGTFTFFTDDPIELARSVPGGRIVKAQISNGRATFAIEGPPNPLRKDHAVAAVAMTLDVDPVNNVARITFGDQAVLIHQGEWSGWLTANFTLIPHISSVHGMVRVFAKQLHPGLEIYLSPINFDPIAPAMPISSPAHWAAEIESDLGPYSTLGIPEDTSALRQEVLTLPEFREQARLVFAEEAKLLSYSLRQFKGGFMFFYFSSVDQNSHILWNKHEGELLKVYREVDDCIGAMRHEQPNAKLMIISDHGFTTFERAVHLNAWLSQRGFLRASVTPAADAGLEAVDWKSTDAYAVGLNGLYINLKGRERLGTVDPGKAKALLASLRDQLLAWRDPGNGRAVIETVTPTAPSSANRNAAPDLEVGYAAGYRASWQTALGQIPANLIEDNNDAWIGDHCVDPDVVPGVLFSSERIQPSSPRLQDVTAAVLKRFGIPPPVGYHGDVF